MRQILIILHGSILVLGACIGYFSIIDHIGMPTLFVSVFLILAPGYIIVQLAATESQISELREHILPRREIFENEGIYFKGYKITPSTQLVRYKYVVSIGVFTFTINSRLFLKEKISENIRSEIYVVISILLGWWGIPWGPIRTIEAIRSNHRGGEQLTLQQALWLRE
jgi:hypothetical protein